MALDYFCFSSIHNPLKDMAIIGGILGWNKYKSCFFFYFISLSLQLYSENYYTLVLSKKKKSIDLLDSSVKFTIFPPSLIILFQNLFFFTLQTFSTKFDNAHLVAKHTAIGVVGIAAAPILAPPITTANTDAV